MNRSERALLDLVFQVFPRPCRLLEAGSNTGHLSLVLAQHGYQVTLLDRLQEPIQQARKSFARKGVQAHFVVGDILDMEGVWDGVWNSGLIQCYEPSARSALINKLCQFAPRVLLIYPDVAHPLFPKHFDPTMPPGIAGCVEYPAPEIPDLLAVHCSEVHHGILSPQRLGLEYPFEYVWGVRKKKA